MTIALLAFGACCLLGVLWACLHVAADRSPDEQALADMEQLAAITRPADLGVAK